MRNYSVKRLTPLADLSITAFEDAIDLLLPDEPRVLVCAGTEYPKEFAGWLWNNWRVVGVTLLPAQILKYPNAWAVYGLTTVVYSEGF